MRSLARWTSNEAADILGSGDAGLHQAALQHHAVIVESPSPSLNFSPLAAQGVVVAALHPGSNTGSSTTADLWLHASEVDRFTSIVDTCPKASVVCARQLRLVEALNPLHRDGTLAALEVESLAYATLQAGPEFATWLASQGRRVRPDTESDLVLVAEQPHAGGTVVQLTLNRPRHKNALNAALRNRIIEVLDALAYRPDIATISLRGNGSAFCIGGDLADFGTVDSPAEAHLIRLATSVAARLLTMSPVFHAHVHGAVVGAGAELSAFANRLSAAPNATFRLPEVSLGLLPGAGGTISLTRRLGRQQAARLLLLDQTINSSEALEIGLIDAIEE